MSPSFAVDNGISVVLLDIEGTTTPIDFVYRKLFPYARKHMAGYLAGHMHDKGVTDSLDGLYKQYLNDAASGQNPPEVKGPADLDGSVAYCHWLMDHDSKNSCLKDIQGRVWSDGYESGELQGEVYPDVPEAMKRWKSQNIRVCIYSSGSILGQKLIFGNTSTGDLTVYIEEFFDTGSGSKRESASYSGIASTLGVPSGSVLFISDRPYELDAASMAGMQALLCVRDGEYPEEEKYEAVEDFNGI